MYTLFFLPLSALAGGLIWRALGKTRLPAAPRALLALACAFALMYVLYTLSLRAAILLYQMGDEKTD